MRNRCKTTTTSNGGPISDQDRWIAAGPTEAEIRSAVGEKIVSQ